MTQPADVLKFALITQVARNGRSNRVEVSTNLELGIVGLAGGGGRHFFLFLVKNREKEQICFSLWECDNGVMNQFILIVYRCW